MFNSLKVKKAINIMSIVIMTIAFLLMLLLPEPYDGINPVVFMLNGTINIPALILFMMFMLCVEGFSYIIFKLSKTKTLDDVQRDIIGWTMHQSLEKLHPSVTILVDAIREMKSMEKKEAQKLMKEQAAAVKKQAEIDKISQSTEIDLKKELANKAELESENFKLKQELEEYYKAKREAEKEINNKW